MKPAAYSLLLAGLVALTGLHTTAQAQQPSRAVTSRLKNLIERLEKEPGAFRAGLQDALDRSRFDGSRREDNINQFVKAFEAAADRLKDRFDDDYSAVGSVSELLRRGALIDQFM